MATIYPESPRSVPPGFAKPSGAYALHALTATVVLLLFVAAYLVTSAWFAYKAYRLLSAGSDNLWVWLAGACAAFLAIFMLKGLFFIKKGAYSAEVEVTARNEPALFEFIHRLADEAGAPRPARVYLSPRVNAAVFYDISILNLLFPSRKNLEIGLGLVNVLTVEELKAVLAHEFGHFAQRSMLIGRWVYMAQQIAAHIVAKRDAFDKFLEGFSRVDVRFAWIAWGLSLIVWAIRSLTDSAFRLLILAQRALSREMEMQADLVAVSLTGSDSLVHALHRLGAADEAWERAVAFASGEIASKRTPMDLYDVQTRIIERLRAIWDEPQYGRPPARPEEKPEAHRLFTAEVAEAPRMWATHPSNRDREENAKRIYIPSAISKTSAWVLFAKPDETRQSMTARVLKRAEGLPPKATREDTLKALNAQFEREAFKRFYRGAYVGRPISRHARSADEMFGNLNAAALADLSRLYPETLAGELKQLRTVMNDIASLEAIRDGLLQPAGGMIRLRGRQIDRSRMRPVIIQLHRERDALRAKIVAHDLACRTAHRVAAKAGGGGWDAYLRGLAGLIHYAEHTSANLRDLYRVFGNVVAVETAVGKVSKAALGRILDAAAEVHVALQAVFDEANAVQLDAPLATRLGYQKWSGRLGQFSLPAPNDASINDWLKSSGGWVEGLASVLDGLRNAALDELLVSEAVVARAHATKEALPQAPAPSRAPSEYPVLLLGKERPLQKRLGWWARFKQADGLFPELARIAVAGVIVGGVLMASGDIGKATIIVHNGLSRVVMVQVADTKTPVGAGLHKSMELAPGEKYAIRTSTMDGKVIETFEAALPNARTHVYNVAGVTPLVEWTAAYGNATAAPERLLGEPRWVETSVDFAFEDPPKTISTKGGGGTRSVLTAVGDGDPRVIEDVANKDGAFPRIVLTHVRWDGTDSRHILAWIRRGAKRPEMQSVLADRLRETPLDPVLLRTEQDLATPEGHAAVCERHRALAASNPANADLRYIAARCADSDEARNTAFIDGYRATPDNPWLAMAAGLSYAERQSWTDAIEPLERASRNQALHDQVALDIVRVRRVADASPGPTVARLEAESERMKALFALEKGATVPRELQPYAELRRGRLDAAVKSAASLPDERARVMRLAAASDGADPQTINAALALKEGDGLDGETVWTSWALAARMGRDTAPYRRAAEKIAGPEQAARMQTFLATARFPTGAAEAEQLLRNMPIEMMGQAYAMGAVALGPAAPPMWRENARRLLFVFERPYLG
jgi:Zn-dependent protease with chaperone function